MRILLVALISLVLFSCKNEETTSEKYERILKKGEWRIEEVKNKTKRFQYGLKFADDYQVFYIDSQGHVIPPHNIERFSIHGDTLVLVDEKFLPDVRFEKGTDLLLIKQLDDEVMILEVIHPEPNLITFRKIH